MSLFGKRKEEVKKIETKIPTGEVAEENKNEVIYEELRKRNVDPDDEPEEETETEEPKKEEVVEDTKEKQELTQEEVINAFANLSRRLTDVESALFRLKSI